MNDVRNFFKRWPRLYYFTMVVFGPVLFCGLSGAGFLRKYPSSGKKLNIGSGPRRLAPDVVNVDVQRHEGVQIVADACAVPLVDGSASRIVSDNVLEHVREPQKAVKEIYRLLESGGLAYVATPFMYPFHSSPSDYQRWTKEGLIELFSDFEIVEIGVRSGPFSALDAYLCHMTGFVLSFGNAALDSFFTNLAMFLFFPIKLLDVVFCRWPGAEKVASVLYCVVKKP